MILRFICKTSMYKVFIRKIVHILKEASILMQLNVS